jgi:hypothetical protein
VIQALPFTVTEIVTSREVIDRDPFIDVVDGAELDPPLAEPPEATLSWLQSGPLTALRR